MFINHLAKVSDELNLIKLTPLGGQRLSGCLLDYASVYGFGTQELYSQPVNNEEEDESELSISCFTIRCMPFAIIVALDNQHEFFSSG